MKTELIVPQHEKMHYTLGPDVQEFMCRVEAHAQLTLTHTGHVEPSTVRVVFVLEQSSSLIMHGWYEHAIDIDLECIMQGAYANADIKIGIKEKNAAKIRVNTLQQHEAPYTQSSLVCKSILSDAAQVIHAGMIHIVPGADNTNAKLHSNHMLFGNGAYAQVQPNLQVLTNDVQCAHGSAIGRPDADMIFYMQARGLETTDVMKLLEEAFFSEVRYY